MAQLNQIIWSNIMWGGCGIFFMCLFGIAVKLEWNSQLTPKAWNRPRNVLKNVLKKHRILGCINFYPLTWYLWARSLTYSQGMDGIAGTGTRDDGWTGPTLKMNLDGVILLKFHRMLFKISLLASILCCGVLLPTYTTIICDPTIVSDRECERLVSLTDFEHLTILSVPEVKHNTIGEREEEWIFGGNSNSSSSLYNNYTTNNNNSTSSLSSLSSSSSSSYIDPISDIPITSTYQPQQPNQNEVLTTSQLIDENGNIIIPPAPTLTQHNADSKWVPGITWRLLTVALVSAIIYVYTCYLLWNEWIDNLALRRVYFLESDHYSIRMKELDDIANLQNKPEDPIIAKRPPFVPHPEMREIPPSVGLYSVLYQLPVSLVTFDTDGDTQMDRQLVATVNFFNECVPNQSGFTSSVVAATIIPDAARVSKVWLKWYKLESKLRMIRYIRKIIQTKTQKLEDGRTDIYDDVATVLKKSNHTIRGVAVSLVDKVATGVNKAKKRATRSSLTSKKGAVGTTSTTDTSGGVEMTNIISAEEKKSLMASSSSHLSSSAAAALAVDVDVDEKDDSGTLRQTASVTSTSTSDDNDNAVGSDDNEDNAEDYDKAKEKDDLDNSSFWQNVFGGGWRKDNDDDEQMKDNIDDNIVEGGPSSVNNEMRISEEFMEGSFIEAKSDDEDSTNEDIESQLLQLPLSCSSSGGENQGLLSSTDNMTGQHPGASTTTIGGGKFYGAKTTGFKYEDYDVREYAKTISHHEETELIDVVDGLGIEELSVFAREYAQSSSSPCPFGFAPNLLKISSIEELREIEDDLLDDLKVLNDELIEAREDVIRGQDDDYEVDSTMISTASFDRGIGGSDSFDDDGDGEGTSRSSCSDFISGGISSIPSPKSERKSLRNLRNRIVGAVASGSSATNQWEKAEEVSSSMREIPESTLKSGYGLVGSGSSSLPLYSKSGGSFACCRYNPCFGETLKSLPKYYGQMKGAGRAFVTALDHPSYAVITFSSRQAAIAARQCLADGGAANSWQQIDEIPIPPLADAPPRNIFFCRGCCRPVTLTINYKEKKCRRWSVYVFLFFFSCFYTVPLAFISIMINPRWLGYYFPNSKSLHDPDNILYKALTGPVSGLATNLFMALLPQIFKFIAYYEGTSSSLEMAERKALLFMWYFMLVTTFFGQYLATMLIQWFYHGTFLLRKYGSK
jgi:hypothetical protein